MFESLKLLLSVIMTSKTNQVLYMLRRFRPLARILPETLYANRGAKLFVTILAVCFILIRTFFLTIGYILLAYMMPVLIMGEGSSAAAFIFAFLWMSLIGACINNYFMNSLPVRNSGTIGVDSTYPISSLDSLRSVPSISR